MNSLLEYNTERNPKRKKIGKERGLKFGNPVKYVLFSANSPATGGPKRHGLGGPKVGEPGGPKTDRPTGLFGPKVGRDLSQIHV